MRERSKFYMATFHFDLVSPERLLLSGEVEQVDVPGSEGDFGVLAGHAPMVTTLRPGILTIRRDGGEVRVVVLGGFAEVSPTGLTVLADLASTVEEFDIAILERHIAEMESQVNAMEPGSLLDKQINRLDHFRTVRMQLQGTAMH